MRKSHDGTQIQTDVRKVNGRFSIRQMCLLTEGRPDLVESRETISFTGSAVIRQAVWIYETPSWLDQQLTLSPCL